MLLFASAASGRVAQICGLRRSLERPYAPFIDWQPFSLTQNVQRDGQVHLLFRVQGAGIIAGIFGPDVDDFN